MSPTFVDTSGVLDAGQGDARPYSVRIIFDLPPRFPSIDHEPSSSSHLRSRSFPIITLSLLVAVL